MIRTLTIALACAFLAIPALAAPMAVPHPALNPQSAPTPVQTCEGGCCEGECGCEGECEPNYDYFRNEPAKGITEEPDGSVGSDIAILLARGTSACGEYREVWRIDCLSVELDRVAARLPKTRAYDKARAEVAAASDKLHAIAMAYADPARPAVRREATVDGTKVRTRRPITPVAPARLPEANAQAAAVLDELSTTLLRSGPTRTAQVELARVAQAVDSTKVLLRSS